MACIRWITSSLHNPARCIIHRGRALDFEICRIHFSSNDVLYLHVNILYFSFTYVYDIHSGCRGNGVVLDVVTIMN